ncbi:hypothetical protein CEXT_194801 [Caerostris extrusa]|uniref:Uncharacterized protein n=1 Tax=Caerostris extrusa TaxID=172846 RepID=A0AAV4MCW2_CAEEX|nr:hypothetical protein CEXT_194801 [Caerostris extrusa]
MIVGKTLFSTRKSYLMSLRQFKEVLRTPKRNRLHLRLTLEGIYHYHLQDHPEVAVLVSSSQESRYPPICSPFTNNERKNIPRRKSTNTLLS